MTVFKGMLLHFWKNKMLVVIITSVFFGFALLFSQGGQSDVFETRSMDLAVVDLSDSEIADGLIEYLEKNNSVEIRTGYDREEIIEEIYLIEIEGAVVIDENIESRFMNGEPAVEIFTDPRGAGNVHLNNEVSKYFRFLEADYTYNGSLDTESVLTTLDNEAEVKLADPATASEGSNFTSMQIYTNFAGYALMLLLLLFIGNIMSDFNLPVLRDRVRVSPVTTTSYTAGIISAQSMMGLFAVIIMFCGGLFIRRDALDGVPLDKIFVALILISFFTLALQFVISSLTTNKFLINGLANFIAIGMGFLSGIFIPGEVFGETVQNIAMFLPLYHFTQIYAEPGITWAESIIPATILVLFTIVMLIIGMIFENKRKSSLKL